MSALTTPQRFLSQPQYRVDPDVSKPLGARIIGGCIPGVCSLRGNAASIVKARGQFGIGTAGGSGNYATAGPARVLIGRDKGASADSRDITFVFVGYVSNNNSIWFYDGQSDGIASWWVKTDASGNLSASYGQSTNLAGTVPIPNGPVVLICHGGTNGGQVARTWVNGVEYAGTAATDSWANSPAFTGMFGSSAYPTTNTFAGTGNLALVLRGNVTSAEAKRITDNPWAFFRAPDVSRMFIGPPGGAGAQTLTPGLLTNSNSFYAPTVTPGDVTLTPGLLTNSQTFYAPTVSPGAVTLTPGLYTNSQTFYAPTVTPGDVTLTPSLFSNGNTFYSPTVTGGEITLLPPLLTNSNSFYAPTVTPGDVTLTPSLFSNGNTFYSPTVSGADTLLPPLLTNSQTFYSPTVTPGDVTLQPARFDNANAIYVPTVSGGSQPLTPDRFDNAATFFAPTVRNYGLTLTQGDIDAIAAAVLALAQTAPIHADVRKMNGAQVIGDGSAGDLWRGA